MRKGDKSRGFYIYKLKSDFLQFFLLFASTLEENWIFSLDFNENFDFYQFSGATFYHKRCNIHQVKNVTFD